jgi:hypothetical protein
MLQALFHADCGAKFRLDVNVRQVSDPKHSAWKTPTMCVRNGHSAQGS